MDTLHCQFGLLDGKGQLHDLNQLFCCEHLGILKGFWTIPASNHVMNHGWTKLRDADLFFSVQKALKCWGDSATKVNTMLDSGFQSSDNEMRQQVYVHRASELKLQPNSGDAAKFRQEEADIFCCGLYPSNSWSCCWCCFWLTSHFCPMSMSLKLWRGPDFIWESWSNQDDVFFCGPSSRFFFQRNRLYIPYIDIHTYPKVHFFTFIYDPWLWPNVLETNLFWLVVTGTMEFYDFPIILGSCHHPNWRFVHHFSEG